MSELIKEQQRQDEQILSADEKNYYRNEYKIFLGLYEIYRDNPSKENLDAIKRHDKKIQEIENKMPENYDFKLETEAVIK
jgi:hypothetical protein